MSEAWSAAMGVPSGEPGGRRGVLALEPDVRRGSGRSRGPRPYRRASSRRCPSPSTPSGRFRPGREGPSPRRTRTGSRRSPEPPAPWAPRQRAPRPAAPRTPAPRTPAPRRPASIHRLINDGPRVSLLSQPPGLGGGSTVGRALVADGLDVPLVVAQLRVVLRALRAPAPRAWRVPPPEGRLSVAGSPSCVRSVSAAPRSSPAAPFSSVAALRSSPPAPGSPRSVPRAASSSRSKDSRAGTYSTAGARWRPEPPRLRRSR